MAHLTLTHDSDGIYTLCFDSATQSTNSLHETFRKELSQALNQLSTFGDNLAGVIITSAKPTFFVGGDIEEIYQLTAEHAHVMFTILESLKQDLKIIELFNKPVVAAINGSALGTGFEIALFCHRRIAINDRSIKLGFPATKIGLIPGAGGIVHVTRLLGFTLGLSFLLDEQVLTPAQALERGLIDELVPDQKTLLSQAKAFIKEQSASYRPPARSGWQFPLDAASMQALYPSISASPALLEKETRGCYPAKNAILSVSVQALTLSFDTALTNESREFASIATNPVTKNMIGTLWLTQNKLKSGFNRPKVKDTTAFKKVAVIGAGMMGVGIAHACAINNIPVVLMDLTQAKADVGKQRIALLLDNAVAKKELTGEDKISALARVSTTHQLTDLRYCDLAIETVVEDLAIKEGLLTSLSKLLPQQAIIASNTSTLPITSLARTSLKPANVVGLHFFSPVHKMTLVEIIRTASTSDDTIARVYDLAQKLQKTPIVVRDARGFFTSRVFSAYVNEGIRLLAEGQNPCAIETLAMQFGMPIGPLAVADQVTLSLIALIRTAEQNEAKATGKTVEENPAYDVVDMLLAQGRTGKPSGLGFYDYQGRQKSLWPGLKNLTPRRDDLPKEDIIHRLAFIQSLETLCCLEEGILSTVAEANVGSILGWGFPRWTGGALQFINHVGVQNFFARAEELANLYGPRFSPSALLQKHAANGDLIVDKG